MIKAIKNILFTLIIFTSYVSLADKSNDDYDIDYVEEEGRLLFKIRGHGIYTHGKQKNLPPPIATNPSAVGSLIQNGFGADTATAIFFNDNIATELSLGFSLLRTKNSTIKSVLNNYNYTNDIGKRKDIYMIPLTVTGQYHIAPFGAIRPYVGGGYHGAYLFTKSKQIKIKNGHGLVVQAGVDFVAKDDTLITLDLRQYLLNTKVTYKNANNATSKIKLNPLLISAGIGFKL